MAQRLAVLGLYRSGSSITAAILAKLGVCMGHDLSEFFEPIALSAQLRRWWREPFLVEDMPRSQRVAELRGWVQDLEQASDAPVVGAKHPLLCLSGHDLQEAWGAETVFIAIMRPIDYSIASVRSLGGFLPVDPAHLQNTLWESRERFLAGRRLLRVRYGDLLARPRQQITRMADCLDLRPSEQQLVEAVDMVHHRLESPRCCQ
jgi:hypothetical protein